MVFTELKIPAGRRPLTRSEARASAILGALFSLLMLGAILDDFTMQRLSIVFLVLFWIPMLVLHEFGHALMARALGWRVPEIVIGFGRELWVWQLGETRVRIKLAPVEGYVLPAPVDARGLRLKSALIYAAGPGAELLLLAVMLMIFGWDGVFNDSSEIGMIALQSLAVVILLGAGFNLLPFSTGGGVSDGLGILSSPFMSEEAIQLRLAAFELHEIHVNLDRADTHSALAGIRSLLERFPQNRGLQFVHASVLSADGQDEAARDMTRTMLALESLSDNERLAWLQLQARSELDADEPSYLVLDLALQKAAKIAPHDATVLALKGASLVQRGNAEAGGNMLADAWRRGGADDAFTLCYLAIAAHRCADSAARDHFVAAFDLLNRSKPLARKLQSLAT
ncbi:MAG: site-2 protease family protein [Gammaproteobacteria bacterium]|nr:site-2 protease family protein [Gammaproteobacteria bacterium]